MKQCCYVWSYITWHTAVLNTEWNGRYDCNTNTVTHCSTDSRVCHKYEYQMVHKIVRQKTYITQWTDERDLHNIHKQQKVNVTDIRQRR